MPNSPYVEQLKSTRTYEHGIIVDIEEFKYQSLWRIFNVLPDVPQTDNERSLIVLEIDNHRLKLLDNAKPPFKPRTRQAEKLLFLYISKKTQRVKIELAAQPYQFGDGVQVSAEIEFLIRIENVNDFWQAVDDPIRPFEEAAIREAKRYFRGLYSIEIVAGPLGTLQSVGQNLHKVKLEEIERKLEMLLRKIDAKGMCIEQVDVYIPLNNDLIKLIQEQSQKLYGRS